MKKRFTIGGAVVGLLCGLGAVVYAFLNAPGAPGIFELILQAIIVGITAAVGALFGFLLGLIVSLFIWRK